MDIKKNCLYFICLAFLGFAATSCETGQEQDAPETTEPVEEVDSPPPSADLENQPDIPKSTHSFATPITEQLVSTYAHLVGHEGDILLGNDHFHAVLAGVPLSRRSSLSIATNSSR